MTPPLVEPSRAAHASLGGYLYQVYLGVERWLELGPDEVLRCEGDEDLDRLLLDGSGGVSEQVKALSGKINLRDEVMKGTLRRFVVSHHALRTGTPPDRRRFVFISTAERRRQKRDPTLPIDALEAWEDAQSDEAVRGQVVAALHTLLPFPEPNKDEHPGQHRFWRSLKAALKCSMQARPGGPISSAPSGGSLRRRTGRTSGPRFKRPCAGGGPRRDSSIGWSARSWRLRAIRIRRSACVPGRIWSDSSRARKRSWPAGPPPLAAGISLGCWAIWTAWRGSFMRRRASCRPALPQAGCCRPPTR